MIYQFGRRQDAAHPGLAEVRGYWEALRGGGGLPQRAQVDPRGMAGMLDRVFLAEEIAPGMARLRLAGQALCGLMGMEVRGMPLSALFDPPSRRPLEAPLRQVFAGETAVTVDVAAETGIGRPALAGRLLLLPLLGFAGRPDMALGCLALTGEVGRTPRRLILARWTAEALAAGAMPSPAMLEAAEAAAPFTPAPPLPPAASDRPRLRLVTADQPADQTVDQTAG
jgi:hypothetical protein